MMKRVVALICALSMVFIFGTLTGCNKNDAGKNDSAPSSTPGTADTTEPSDAAEPAAEPADDTVYTLKVSTARGENTWFAKMYNDIAAELKEKSNGRLVLEIFHNNTLGAPADIWNMFTQGAIDMLDLSPGMIGSFPVSEVLNVPFYLEGNENVANCMWDLLNAGLLKEYTEHMKVLMFLPAGGVELFTSKKQITSIDDFKGMKACGSSAIMSMCIEALGGTAVATQPAEQVTSLTQGVLDGVITGANFAEIMSLYEPAKYMMRYNIAMSCMFFGINNNSWNKLPADLQQLLVDTCDRWFNDFYKDKIESEYSGVLERLEGHGVTIYEPSEQLVSDMKAATAHLLDVYKQRLTEAGLDVDAVMAVVDKYVK